MTLTERLNWMVHHCQIIATPAAGFQTFPFRETLVEAAEAIERRWVEGKDERLHCPCHLAVEKKLAALHTAASAKLSLRPAIAGKGGPGGPDFVLKEDCDRIYDVADWLVAEVLQLSDRGASADNKPLYTESKQCRGDVR